MPFQSYPSIVVFGLRKRRLLESGNMGLRSARGFCAAPGAHQMIGRTAPWFSRFQPSRNQVMVSTIN